LLDFFADTTPWPRRLWEVSSGLALSEAHEAGKWQAQRVLGAASVTWYLSALERQLGPDRGLGDGKLRKHVVVLLRSNLAPESPERRQLNQLLPTVINGYLDRWRDTIAQGKPPSPERPEILFRRSRPGRHSPGESWATVSRRSGRCGSTDTRTRCP
jgi:hypothetical protein